jgi:sugar lactone lactonase YvrE
MRFFGHRLSITSTVIHLGIFASLTAGLCASANGQTAPYVLPYTMSTYAGGNAQYTVGASCASGGIALDSAGDGCLALNGAINGDPHDVRVDPRGYVYFIDDNNGSSGVVHRVNPFTQLLTIFAGNLAGNKVCTPNVSKYGDGCLANDGVANDNPAVLTTPNILKASRGIGTASNGNVLISGYNDYYEHVILASSGYMQLLAGTGITGNTNGPVGTSQVGQSRGIGSDPTGTVTYIADTNNNLLRQVYNGITSTLSAANTGSAKNVVSNTAIANEQLDGPEDAQTDSYGNVYIANASDGVIMAIYKGGTLPGISNPVVNNVYQIAGYYSPTATTNPFTYPSAPYANNIAPAYPATTITFGSPRKISLDSHNNLYIADSTTSTNTNNVVWFLDSATGYMRVISGNYGQPANGPAIGCGNSSTIGDGCPGTLASFYTIYSGTNTDGAVAADNQGNLYLSDAEGGVVAASRIRKQLSGLNFPTTANGSTVTQTIDLHFAASDTPAATKPYVLTAKGSDFTLGTATCAATNNDGTTDCLLPITFTPTIAGYDTATLTVTSAKGGVGTYLVSGQGTAASIAFDPGNINLLSPTTKAAQGIALDGAGNAYIADTGNNRVLFYNATTGATTTFAGGATTVCGGATDAFGDGCLATQATLNGPKAVAIDTAGSVYIADTGNNLIRKVTPGTGLITRYAGGGSASTAGGTCSGLSASITSPVATAFDALGNGCPATLAVFSKPSGLAADNLGSIYVADTGSNTIRVIASNGYVSNLAGGGTVCSSAVDSLGDGCSSNATVFNAPTALAFDNVNKALLVADTGDSDVRKISLGTTFTVASNIATNILIQPVSIVAGNGQAGSSLSANGTGAGSQLNAPTGVAVDPAGNVYIADTGNGSVRLVNAASGILSTIVGINAVPGTTPAGGASAAITAFQITGNVVTFTAANTFTEGQNVVVSGLTSTVGQTLNGKTFAVIAAGLSATQFSAIVSAANTALTSDAGTASPASSTATLTELSSPGAVAVLPSGNLIVVDSGNNRLLSDTRTQVSYNFGRVNVNSASPVQNFTELNIGTNAATLPAFVQAPVNSQYTLTNAANSTGTIAACATGALAPGAICNLQAQFLPTATTTGYSGVTYTQTVTPTLPTGTPSIALIGVGAILTTTTSTVAQTSPVPPATSQYGSSLTLGGTVTPSSCNTSAPSCSPTGTLTFIVDGVSLGSVALSATGTASQIVTGLAVGSHTIGCSYSGDNFYAASGCGAVTITVAQASTTAVISASNNNQVQFDNCANTVIAGTTYVQCGTTVLSATVASSTIGVPTGSVTFSANGKYLPLNAANTPTAFPLSPTGVAVETLQELLSTNSVPGLSATVPTGIEVSNTTLPPGTYTLTCNYTGSSNYAASSCPGITFTVLPPAPAISGIVGRGCSLAVLTISFTVTAVDTNPCNGEQFLNGAPEVSTAQGSTTDATLFLQPTDTLAGTLTFSCSGLPTNSTCTFSPTSIALTASTSHVTPVAVDVTLWTDIQPGTVPHAGLRYPSIGPNASSAHRGVLLAQTVSQILGWPLTLLGFAGLLFRRKLGRIRGLALVALFTLMTGSALTLTGCAGPGVYSPALTPAGVYPITITVTNGSVTATTLVYFNVNAPGIPGQEGKYGTGK